MGGAAGANRAEGRWLRLCFDPGNQLRHGLGRQILLADDPQRRAGEQSNGLEVAQDIVVERVDCGRSDMACPLPDADGVAVRPGMDDAPGRYRAACAAESLDHDWLTKRSLH